MEKESKLSNEQKNYIDNLKLIMDQRNIKRKTLEEEIPEVHVTNLSAAFNYKRPISDTNSMYIANYLGENVLDMKTEGYARKKYYTAESIDLIELLCATPYYEVVMKLVGCYILSCLVCISIAEFRGYLAINVIGNVTLTWFIVVLGASMRKITNCQFRTPIIRRKLKLINEYKYAAVFFLSILEMLVCSQRYYETFMQLLLTLLFVEASGLFSKNMMEESKKIVKGYYVCYIGIRVIEIWALCIYCIDLYVKFKA